MVYTMSAAYCPHIGKCYSRQDLSYQKDFKLHRGQNKTHLALNVSHAKLGYGLCKSVLQALDVTLNDSRQEQ